eukprot:TRINITY_DN29657_c0_g1_i1.p1 TRINITY_DN29657_c0_g1~~TRINITY_DN29657_c0_g1_i1.p1  ORF type:complete len:274 (-),score=43.88 TRINITY_DN29657_c0_g1_i1:365-1186(-)
MDAARIRREREAMRQQWMAERAVDLDREAVMDEFSAEGEEEPYVPSCFEQKPPSRGAGPKPEEVLHRLSERISDRLRQELRVEMRREALSVDDEKAAIGTKVEEMLNEDLSANTCLVCYELMVPPDRAPMMLFPCGHTFCAACLNRNQRERGRQCAYCRRKIEYQAVNHSLQTMIEAFIEKRNRLGEENIVAKLGDRASAPPAASSHPPASASYYKDQHNALRVRMRVLEGEAREARERQLQHERCVSSAQKNPRAPTGPGTRGGCPVTSGPE